jgi:hypothetical protein
LSLALADRTLERVQLIDDEPSVRSGYHYAVEELHLAPTEVLGPIPNLQALLSSFNQQHDAVICDYNLKTKNYSTFNGDELVAKLYENGYPAVLCTRFNDQLPEAVRARRRMIPVILKPTELSAESLTAAFTTCIEEFAGHFSAPRKPWRSQIRVEGGELLAGDQLRLNVVISSWDPSIGLSFDVPIAKNPALEYLSQCVQRGDIGRVYGKVNIGADRADDIFIHDWVMR